MTEKHLDIEEHFHSKDKKRYRKERKILSKKDRSKYKKTDLEKKKKELPKEKGLIRGRVLSILSEGTLVESDDKRLYTCTLRGSLKKEKARMKNLVAVGDFVLFSPEEDLTGSIAYVEERSSILSRAEQISRHKQQLIAVNIDQVLITTSLMLPGLKPNLIDRYIIAALKGNMKPILVINKIDLFEHPPQELNEDKIEKERALYKEVLSIYPDLDLPVYPVSTVTLEGMEALKKAMHGKSSVFSGQSGTGKTSLINALTGSDMRTGEVIARTRKGMHTTTTTCLLPIEGEGFCIDTPGIKSFGMWDLQIEDLKHYFFEIADYAQECKYPNCMHLQEPECGVQKALDAGKISHLRFDSYCALIKTLKEDHKSR